MKIRRIVLSLAVVIFFAAIASLLFALYTETGTSLVMKAVQSAASGAINANKVTGRAGYRLHVEGLTLRVSGNTVNVASTDLQWHPFYLVLGKLAIDKLQLNNVRIIEDGKEKEPVDLSLPRLSRWISVFRAWINLLSINGLTYTARDSEPVSIDTITAGILLDRGVLYLDGLNVKNDQADVTGVVILDLVYPGLRAGLNAAFHEKTLGLDTIFVSVNLPASRGKEQAAGPILLKAFAGKKERLRLDGTIGLLRQAVRITHAKLTKADNGGTIEVNAAIDLSGSKPVFDISGNLAKLDLAPEIPQSTSLSGDFKIAGNTDDFKGDISLSNAGPSWKEMTLRGNLIGTKETVRLRDLEVKIIGGTVLGNVELARDSQTVSAEVRGTGLNTAKIEPGLSGNINFRLNGQLKIPDDKPMKGFIKAVVHNSTFQKRPLTADIDAAFDNGLIKITSLSARGNGFSLNARGTVQERVAWLVRIDDASKISPGTTGTLVAEGWARWRGNEAAGALTARGSNIAWGTLLVRSFDADITMPEGYDGPVAASITANKFSYGVIKADTINLAVNGTTGDHRISFVNTFEKDRIEALARGAYAEGAWEGTLIRMSGREVLYGNWDLQKPSTVRIARNGASLSGFFIAGPGGERLKLNADLAFSPLVGSIDAEWRSINLGRVNKIVRNVRLEGRTSGDSHVEWLKNNRLIIKSTITGAGSYAHGQMNPLKADFTSRVNWDGTGLNGTLNVDLGNRGSLNATVLSKEPARFSMPARGTFHGEWARLDLALLQPVIGDIVTIKGYLSGNVKGNFLPESRFNLNGKTSLADGFFSWKTDQGEFTAPIREAAVNMDWDGPSFRGDTKITLGQFGSARAEFRLPLPARFPVAMDASGPLLISANGEMNERGLITALFPGMAQETKGQISFDIAATGTTADPRLNGRMNLKKASAYLPSAGMDLKDVNAEIAFNNDRITLSSFLARSGPGQISVAGTAQHSRGKVSGFEATVRGDRFQAVRLPEVTLLASPDISIKGDTRKISVRGSVLIPEALIKEQQQENLIKPSPDVVIVGQEDAHEKLPFELDLLVTVRMGEKVAVKAYGIDTRLTGAVDIAMTGPGDIRARGAIKTEEGKYDAYGVKLNVRRGIISFGGGPAKEANLDILALRRIQDTDKGIVLAGVAVTGTPDKPAVRLYAQPSMPDKDILSYIVLGRAGGPGSEGDTALLARAASGLLLGSKASAVQRTLGFDVDVQQQGSSATQSIVKVGRYLSPKLYVGFGRSMAGGENTFLLRYRLTKKLDVESTVGNQTGGAIYYRVEFD